MKKVLVGLALLLNFAGGCVSNQGTHIRVATATSAQLDAIEEGETVWFEFQPGDVVPVQFAFVGVAEGANEQPVMLRAKRKFWFVASKNGPMRISFDGKTFAGAQSTQAVIGVMPRDDGQGGQVGWILYIGESGDVQTELASAAGR